MLDYIYRLSDVSIFLILSTFFIFFSIVSVCIVKHFIPHELRSKDNQVIGSVASFVGIIYSVLAGLTALYLFNILNYTTDAVQREASAVADVYRDSKWLHDPVKSEIHNQIKIYIDKVINTEWPEMQTGKDVAEDGNVIIDKISSDLRNYALTTNSESLIIHNMLQEIKALYDARQERINMSFSQLSSETWIVILIGTFLTLGMNYLLGMNFYLHLVTVSAAALMASSMIFLLITLDRPFQGEFIIEPDAFRSVLHFIKTESVEPSATSPIKK